MKTSRRRRAIRRAIDFLRDRTPEALLMVTIPALLVYPVLVFRAFGGGARVFWYAARRGEVSAMDYVVNIGSAAVATLGTAAVLVLLLSRWGRIWACARKMILEALNRRVVVGLVVFFVIVTPLLPFILKSEGNPISQVQITLTYSLLLAQLLLTLLAVFLGLSSMSEEIDYKEIQITDVKPIPRWQFLAGKWIGVMLIVNFLLYAMGGSTYLLVQGVQSGSAQRVVDRLLADTPEKPLTAWTEKLVEKERRDVKEQVFASRLSARPEPPDVAAAVEVELVDRQKKNELPEFMSVDRARDLLTEIYVQRAGTIGPGETKGWVIKGLLPSKDPEKFVYIRFKMTSPTSVPDRKVFGDWLIRPPKEGMAYGLAMSRWTINAYQEFKAPSSLIREDGTLEIAFRNRDPRGISVHFDPQEGIEILQRVEGFFPNYWRSLLVLQCHLALLAAVGIMAGSLLSFPVGALLVGAMFFIGLISGWLQSGFHEQVAPNWQVLYDSRLPGADEVPAWYQVFSNVLLKFFLVVLRSLPDITEYSPISHVATGRLVPWLMVARAVTVMVFIKGGIVALVAILLFRRKELARVQV